MNLKRSCSPLILNIIRFLSGTDKRCSSGFNDLTVTVANWRRIPLGRRRGPGDGGARLHARQSADATQRKHRAALSRLHESMLLSSAADAQLIVASHANIQAARDHFHRRLAFILS